MTTGVAPAKLLMNKLLRDKLPNIKGEQSELFETVKVKDTNQKLRNKQYFDKKHNVKENEINEGDWVIMKQQKGKTKSKFQYKPLKVLKVKGSSIIVEKDGKEIMRNSSEIRKLKYDKNLPPNHEEDLFDNSFNIASEEDQIESNIIQNNPAVVQNEEPSTDLEAANNEESSSDIEGSNSDEESQSEESVSENGDDPLLRTNQTIPKRDQLISYIMKNEDQWLEGKVLYQQPKKRGKWSSWVNIRNTGEPEGYCVNWNSVESWRPL